MKYREAPEIKWVPMVCSVCGFIDECLNPAHWYCRQCAGYVKQPEELKPVEPPRLVAKTLITRRG